MTDLDESILKLGRLILDKEKLEGKLKGIWTHRKHSIHEEQECQVSDSTQVIDIDSQDVIDILNKKIFKIKTEINAIKEQLKLFDGVMG